MKNIKNLLIQFLVGVGIGGIIEAIISLYLGFDFVGYPEFLARVNPGTGRIIQVLIYGGFGLIPELSSIILKLREEYSRRKQIIHFLILISYFIISGIYLRWFEASKILIYPIGVFVIIYIIIGIIYYIHDKKTIDAVNKKLSK